MTSSPGSASTASSPHQGYLDVDLRLLRPHFDQQGTIPDKSCQGEVACPILTDGLQWTPDARRLLTGNDKGQFTLWNGASFNYESITQVHDDSIRAMSYSHNGQALVSTDKAGWIKYFTPHLTNIHGFQGHREACHGVAWSPNNEWFVTGGDDGLVKIWNYRAAETERELSGHGWDVRCVDWHPTKGLVVSGSKDMLVKFWDPRTGKDLSTLHSHKAVVNACTWNPDGNIVATAGGDNVIRLFDIRTFRELESMKGHTKEVNCLEWHPIHHSLLCSGDAAGSIAYWSMQAPDPSKPVTMMENAHDDAVFSLSFHPLGHILCSGSKDFTARFWCRARPAGGHETDKYHLGEEGAMRAEQAQATSKWPGLPPPGESLPGLPGLGNASARDSPTPSRTVTPSGPPGLGELPGLGRGPPTSSEPHRRQWGAPGSGGDRGNFGRERDGDGDRGGYGVRGGGRNFGRGGGEGGRDFGRGGDQGGRDFGRGGDQGGRDFGRNRDRDADPYGGRSRRDLDRQPGQGFNQGHSGGGFGGSTGAYPPAPAGYGNGPNAQNGHGRQQGGFGGGAAGGAGGPGGYGQQSGHGQGGGYGPAGGQGGHQSGGQSGYQQGGYGQQGGRGGYGRR